ncbi:MAG: GntR family transcriptional regulator [Bifidobacteriaceae bacterium]|jgi:GntR family transcriptional regulator|nr:GntR family transcriptional regulator [Bifidobacteriaceae bacterium]
MIGAAPTPTRRPSATGATYSALLAQIEHGVHPPGTRLPGERKLSAELGVSRSTLHQALTLLEKDGLVRVSPQRGWIVAGPMVSEPPSTLQSFTEMARAKGLRPGARVLTKATRPADLDEADRLGLAPTSQVLDLTRLRSLDAIPVCLDRVVIPMALAAGLAQIDLTDASLFAELARLGVQIARSSYAVQAVEAAAWVAEALAIEPGSPVLLGRETAFSATGSVVLIGESRYRGDAYQFKADLFRIHA